MAIDPDVGVNYVHAALPARDKGSMSGSSTGGHGSRTAVAPPAAGPRWLALEAR